MSTIDDVRAMGKDVNNTLDAIEKMKERLDRAGTRINKEFRDISEKLQTQQFNKDKVKEFWEQPYAIVPKRHEEWYVIAPTFLDFQIGWLEKTVKGWNYFIVNKYVQWLAQVPTDLQEKFKFKKPLPLKVFDHTVLTGKDHQEETWGRYQKHFLKREGKDKIRIKKGHEFKLLAEMIGDGILPFMPKPIAKEHARKPENVGFELRPYQKEAWEMFEKVGAVGAYWPFGAGKTFFGLWAAACIRGKKLIVVPTTTLREQWQARIKQYIPQYADEIEIFTYHAYKKLRNREFVLVIFDECHRLPANTFSRLATLRTEYRIGLSATPYREDGRTDYIIALTGYPQGMNWSEIIAQGYVNKPTVTLYILPGMREKLAKISEIMKDERKTLIYSYWLDAGKKISNWLKVPFVYGDTRNRLEILKQADVAVVSSVGGEGVSLPDLERVIEVTGQYGSRREEAQLMGRLFHSTEKEPEHIILMTEEELEKYEKRLLAIYEKGFRINIVR